MNMTRPTLDAVLNFKESDLAANREGEFSDTQREIVVMLGKITRAQLRPAISANPIRSTTGTLPQIRVVTGRVHTLSETRFVRTAGMSSGLLVETFHLIVHGDREDIDLPITQTAMDAFEPNGRYTVYYYMNKETPTLLSVHRAE